MKNQAFKIILGIILILNISCEKENLQSTEQENLVVVQAYLYPNQSVEDISLSSMVLFDSTVTGSSYINDANVKIKWNGFEYLLTPLGANGKYKYIGDELKVLENNTYEIEFEYYNKTIYALTQVPEKPKNLSISLSNYSIDQDLAYNSRREFLSSVPDIIVSWDNNENDYYYVLVENIESNPETIDLGFSLPGSFTYISQPFQGNSFTLLPFLSIQQYGTHLIKVYKVNQEYADLYESIEQDSRNLNEPLSNIENGLGIFTAFNCDSIYLRVIKN